MNELVTKVEKWSKDKNLHLAESSKQMLFQSMHPIKDATAIYT